MSQDMSDIVKALAAKYSGTSTEQKKAPAPPPPPSPRREYASQSYPSRVDTSITSSRVVARASELRGDELGYLERGAMQRSTKAPAGRPARAPFKLAECDWQELETLPMHKGMTFDSWLKEACIPTLVEDYDSDYPRASRLYLARKRDLHRGGGT